MQNSLNKFFFFKAMDQAEDVPTASTDCQTRRELKPELFLFLRS